MNRYDAEMCERELRRDFSDSLYSVKILDTTNVAPWRDTYGQSDCLMIVAMVDARDQKNLPTQITQIETHSLTILSAMLGAWSVCRAQRSIT